jgi:hypothetical protein
MSRGLDARHEVFFYLRSGTNEEYRERMGAPGVIVAGATGI